MKINIYKTAVLFFIIQSLLIVLLLNNNFMERFSFLQSLRSDLVDLVFGLLILTFNLAAIVIARYLYISGEEAERLKTASLKHAFMLEQNRIYRQHHHDLRNHLTVIMGLVKLEKYQELMNYLELYLNDVNDALFKVQSGLDEVDVLISSKIESARMKGIKINVHVAAKIESGKKNIFNLVTILGNILDNAMEAVQDLEGSRQKISLSIEQDPLDYIITVSNPMLAAELIRPEQFLMEGFSTKKEGRGQGLFIVKKMTERLGGNVSIKTHGGRFTIRIEIPKHKLRKE